MAATRASESDEWDAAPAPRRKGARRRSEIPRDVLAAMNRGELETVTLVEWLAVDLATLVAHVAPESGFDAAATRRLVARATELAEEGVMERVRGLGAAVRAELPRGKPGERVYERLATHRSDVARELAAYSVRAEELALDERLARMRRFAADSHMAVRECAWEALRPHLVKELDRALALLQPWTVDADPNVRRCAIEATRPRGVWTAHCEPLKERPERAEPLLEPVRSDASDYVRRSVANWVNDASKSRPDWARALCARWTRESRTQETQWTVRHALRTLRKS
ncbi:MAG: DNA alkylation repair protein [Planctomycetes bacterium]|nr:DNA alkylation repair protein [Planctomycetota bacterium]